MMPFKLLLIFIGGGIGSVLRYLCQGWFQGKLAPQGLFPAGTLLVNLIGCFLIGLIMELLAFKLNPNYKLALVMGLLGGFTTFSTFGYESLNLAEGKQYFLASVYVLLSVAVGLFAVWVGKTLVRAF